MFSAIKHKSRNLSLAGAALLMSSPSFAAASDGLVGIANRGKTAVDAFNQLALGGFYLAGVVVFGIGCYLIYKEQGESGRGHGKKGIVGMLVGGALLAMPSMIGLTQTTVAGSDQQTSACIGGGSCTY